MLREDNNKQLVSEGNSAITVRVGYVVIRQMLSDEKEKEEKDSCDDIQYVSLHLRNSHYNGLSFKTLLYHFYVRKLSA